MTYLVREKDGRWLIYASGACILDCEDEATALATVTAASTLMQQPDRSSEFPPFTSRSRRADAPEATTIAARCG